VFTALSFLLSGIFSLAGYRMVSPIKYLCFNQKMIRFIPLIFVLLSLLLVVFFGSLLGAGLLLPLALVGIWDVVQRKHSLYRNYPLIGHLRDFGEQIRPQIHQYFIESDTEGKPFDREQRSLVYRRAKNTMDTLPFGTERDVTTVGYESLNHSIKPASIPEHKRRVTIGNHQCTQPYSSSLLNISAMSFGSLSSAAIRALNKGAQIGGFAHDTGEGGLSPYHLEYGGDIIWEIGTGYFGCRTDSGDFDPEQFAEKAGISQVKMIEIKLSQGAKPGHGGILPAAKISAEIASARGVPVSKDCISPAQHKAFDSPMGLLHFLQRLRELSQGKPVGFKLCIGHRHEFLAICKAMLDLKIYPDFIVIDGKEGGTGAAPAEFVDHVGTPLRGGLSFAHNALVGTGLRQHIQLGASGKVVSGFDMAMCLALGANWCNAARGFMLALGCLQSQKCHTNRCPVGIATQDKRRQRGLVVEDKYQRVVNFQNHTVQSLFDLATAAGVASPQELWLHHFQRRNPNGDVVPLETFLALCDSELITKKALGKLWSTPWERARSHTFLPVL
jgi:glutamate synthase domain-containing protein 2